VRADGAGYGGVVDPLPVGRARDGVSRVEGQARVGRKVECETMECSSRAGGKRRGFE